VTQPSSTALNSKSVDLIAQLYMSRFRNLFKMAEQIATKKQKTSGPLIGTHKYVLIEPSLLRQELYGLQKSLLLIQAFL
jgi:hypothetical protein